MNPKSNRALSKAFLCSIACLWLTVANAQDAYRIQDEENLLSKKELQYIEKSIDYQLEFFNNLFPEKRASRDDVKLTVYNTYDKYLKHQYQAGVEIRKSQAYYSVRDKEVVVCKSKNPGEFLKACAHELNHYLLFQCVQRPPSWLIEGLATYFQDIKLSSKTIKHEDNKYYRARVKTLIQLRDVDLKDFVNWGHKKFADVSFSNESYGYAVSYCMTAYLFQRNEAALHAIIREIAKETPTEKAFDLHYPGGFQAFEEEFIACYS